MGASCNTDALRRHVSAKSNVTQYAFWNAVRKASSGLHWLESIDIKFSLSAVGLDDALD